MAHCKAEGWAMKHLYSTLIYQPDPRKGEFINVGIVVFKEEGTPDVRISGNATQRAKVLDPDTPPSFFADWQEMFIDTLQACPATRQHELLQYSLGVKASGQTGFFTASNEEEYEVWIAKIIHELTGEQTTLKLRAGL
jgi:hypothetical protein